MIIVTDILKKPFDEGAKIASKNIIKALAHYSCYVISLNTTSKLPFVDSYFHTNKLLINTAFYKTLINQQTPSIFYIPSSSVTLFSLLRSKLMNIITGKEVYIISLQPRKYSLISKAFVRLLAPKKIITQSKTSSQYLTKIGLPNTIVPLGVDDKKYFQLNTLKRNKLREYHKISPEKTVLLHVGHIQNSRNLDWLITINEADDDIEIILVGSSFNQNNKALYNNLQKANIRIISDYTSNMEDFYNIADYYVFPVLRNDGSIETPLSVIEAMACNTPIITTKFGSLPDTFIGDNDFHYIDSPQDIIKIVKMKKTHPCRNREKIAPFTWREIAKQLVNIIEA